MYFGLVIFQNVMHDLIAYNHMASDDILMTCNILSESIG